MKICATLLIPLLLFFIPSNVEALENDLVITISTAGEAKITHNLNTKTTVSSITIQSISDKISNILATDEKGIFLATNQKDDSIRIDTLGASSAKLSYNAEIVSSHLGIWRISYNSLGESTVILPSLSNILSVNNIPIDIIDNAIVMPPGEISISYTLRAVTAKNFMVTVDGTNYSVEIMTGSQVSNFKPSSDSIMLTVDDDVPILVILPKSLLAGPYEVQLNGNPIDFKQYYQNSTHSWIRIEPTEGGSIMIIDTSKQAFDQISQQPQGGCLIATATFGSEMAPQVQQLREFRDNTLLKTESGSVFMSGFNQFYYSFSPTIADWERQNPAFKETVKLTITPLLTSLSILNYVDIDSEAEVLGYGITIIFLNIGMYFIAPVIAIIELKKRFH